MGTLYSDCCIGARIWLVVLHVWCDDEWQSRVWDVLFLDLLSAVSAQTVRAGAMKGQLHLDRGLQVLHQCATEVLDGFCVST